MLVRGRFGTQLRGATTLGWARQTHRRQLVHSKSAPRARVMAYAASNGAMQQSGKTYEDASMGEVLVQSYGTVGKNPPSGRRAGIVLHPTSLNGPYGTGDLGEGCFKFVDWLANAGMNAWQVLPLVPPDEEYFSPYSGQDALTGNPLLISLERLVQANLLDKSDLPEKMPNSGEADFAAASAAKWPCLHKAAARLLDSPDNARLQQGLAQFRQKNAWIEESALFDCLRREAPRADKPWWDWEPELRDRNADALSAARQRFQRDIDVFIAVQFLFDTQWSVVKEYANSKGVALIGDMPIYVGGQSADVWANQSLFELGSDARPTQVSGVPPDAFSDTGQLWGSPLYRWDAHHAEDYAWWAQRIGRAGQVYDVTRIDHFRAFAGFWAVDADKETAMIGDWRKGPGKPLFDAVTRRLGSSAPEIMAEDLGVITPDVTKLRKDIDAPGMVVLQFAWGGGYDNTHLPHNHYANSFVYPGTHDNETTVGWWKDSATAQERVYCKAYLKCDGSDIAGAFIHESMRSVSGTAMIMMQDVMRLDNASRMNSPGKAAGNWAWRLPADFSFTKLGREAAELRGYATMFDRCPTMKAREEAAAALAEEAPAATKSASSDNGADPLEAYCADVPDADECRVFEV